LKNDLAEFVAMFRWRETVKMFRLRETVEFFLTAQRRHFVNETEKHRGIVQTLRL